MMPDNLPHMTSTITRLPPRQCSKSNERNKNRDYRIDQFKFIAFLGVLCIHFVAQWNEHHTTNAPYAVEILSFLGRFSVPFFFITSGTFVKMQEPAGKLILHYAKRLLLPFAVWGAVYWVQDILMAKAYNFDAMHHAGFYIDFLETGGTAFHLWFLTALWVAIAVLILAHRFFSPGVILWGAFLLFGVGLMLTPYTTMIWGSHPPFQHMETRNGIFFGLLFVTIGAALKKRLQSTTFKTGLALLAVGYALQAAETVFLKSHYNSGMLTHDFLISTPMIGVGAFVVALHMPFQSAVLASLGRYSLGLYAAHVLFLKIFMEFFPSDGLSAIAACFLLSLASTVALALALARGKATRFLVA